jgi:uncharacterized protein YdaU (DUF1376 family)
MAREQAPAFQFYARDWLADSDVIAMSCAERGAYINLLAACWLEGSLPTDDGALRRIAGADSEEWEQLWTIVARRFQVRDGRYCNRRLDEERAKQRRFKRLQSDKGKRSAAIRLQPDVNRSSTEAQPDTQPKVNSASASSSAFASSKEQEGIGADAPTPIVEETGLTPRRLGELWHTLTGEAFPDVLGYEEWSEARIRTCRARIKEHPDEDYWTRAIEGINRSPFLNGVNDRKWVASFDWLIKPDTATKVLEGKYDRRMVVKL